MKQTVAQIAANRIVATLRRPMTQPRQGARPVDAGLDAPLPQAGTTPAPRFTDWAMI